MSEIVSETAVKARDHWGNIVSRAQHAGTITLITRRGSIDAAVVPADIAELIKNVGGIENARTILTNAAVAG